MRLTVVTVCLVLGLLMEVALEFRHVSAAAVSPAAIAFGNAQRLRNVLVRSRATVGLVPRRTTLFAGPRQAYGDEYFDYEDEEEEDEQAEEEEELQAALSETTAAGGGEQYEDEDADEGGGDVAQEEEEDDDEGEDEEDAGRQLKRKYLIRRLMGISM